MSDSDLKRAAIEIFQRTLASIEVERVVLSAVRRDQDLLSISSTLIDLADYDYVLVIGIGKACSGMARAVGSVLGDKLTTGVIATNALTTASSDAPMPPAIRVIISGHPVPNEGSLEAARTALALLRKYDSRRTLVFFLVTGGGSSQFELPVEPLTLNDLQRINQELVTSGKVISEMNKERRLISQVKGGRLAEAAPNSRQVSLYISDVNTGDLQTVASGPTLPGPPESIHELLLDNPRALDVAATIARDAGFEVQIARDLVEGDMDDMLSEHFVRLNALQASHVSSRVCLISGGEVICPVRGSGRGGRNQEFVLRSLDRFSGDRRKHTVVLSAGTDGIDGNSPAAGAVIDSWRQTTLSPEPYLNNSDSFGYFDATGEALITGATGNNVRDIRILLECGDLSPHS